MFIGLLSLFFFMKTSLGSIVCSERLLPGLPDDKITASSMYNQQYQPAFARLNNTVEGPWCNRQDEKAPYIQVKMNATTVVGIITQGNHRWHFWVKTYHVRYSEDGVNYVKEPGGSKTIFNGNSDRTTWVTNKFKAGIRLQILRIYPVECYVWCCLRFDVIGCQATDVMTTSAMSESINEFNTFTEEIQATPVRSATGMMTRSVQKLTTFTEEGQATPIRPAAVVMTMTALTKSIQELNTFTEEIKATPTTLGITAPFVETTMKFLQKSTESKYMSLTKTELSTPTDVPPFASSTLSAQSMTSMTPTNLGETLNKGNTTTEPHCYIVCSKNHTEQELVEMVRKLKQELRTDKKKTSLQVRSKTSASDERKSSTAIGYVGVAILCAVGIGVLLLDLPHLVQFLNQIKVHKKVTPAV